MKQSMFGVIALVALILVPAPAQAQRGFFSVDFGAQKPKDEFFFQNLIQELRGEDAEFDAEYDLDTMPLFSVGGGFMVTDWFGFGLAYTQARRDGGVSAFASIPDLFAFNNNAAAETIVDELERRERALHMNAIFAVNLGRVVIQFSGGPTYFRLTQDLVTDIRYTETFNPHRITITEVHVDTFDANTWGYNIGTDVAVYFTDVVGVGGLLRYTRADAPLIFGLGQNAGSTETFDNRVGGLQFGGGLRLRF